MEAELVFKAVCDIVQIILFLIGCYYFVLSLFSLVVPQKTVEGGKMHTFALLIAAHNEENVIAELVESLKQLNYPTERYGIFVVADNCTDKTAELAKKSGAFVWERFDTVNRGKGHALEFAFKKLFAISEGYEYICVFDADNLVEKDFLVYMNDKINEGYRAVQGYLDSKNPTDNWLTFSYSLWYWLNNRLSQLARSNVKLGCRLGGTGFAVESELIRKYGWGATCLAEDAEFTFKLALNDIKVGWAHSAVVYDEKPKKLGVSVRQRERWVRGLVTVANEYVRPLLKKTVCEKSSGAFNMLMNFWGDTLQVVATLYSWLICILIAVLDKSTAFYKLVLEMWTSSSLMLVLILVLALGNLFVFVAALYNDGKLNRDIMKNVPGFIIYIATWIPIGIVSLFGREPKEWFHTPHSGKRG